MCFIYSTESKILIITSAYNRPEFVEVQARTFTKFLRDEYEFVVFNDANSSAVYSQIEQMCDKWECKMHKNSSGNTY